MSETRAQRRKRQARASLITAFRELVANRPVADITIRDIAEKADIALGGFYNHFASKEELLDTAAREFLTDIAGDIDKQNANSQNSAETVARGLVALDQTANSNPHLGWFAIHASQQRPELMKAILESFERDFRQGVKNRSFDQPNVELAIDCVRSSLFSFLKNRLQGHVGEESVPDFVQLVLRVVGADRATATKTAKRVWRTRNTH